MLIDGEMRDNEGLMLQEMIKVAACGVGLVLLIIAGMIVVML